VNKWRQAAEVFLDDCPDCQKEVRAAFKEIRVDCYSTHLAVVPKIMPKDISKAAQWIKQAIKEKLERQP